MSVFIWLTEIDKLKNIHLVPSDELYMDEDHHNGIKRKAIYNLL